MKVEIYKRTNVYYSSDHEWIDFQGAVAYIGVCAFKLTGFKEIEQIHFSESAEFKKKGEVIATIHYRDYRIEVQMPVDGRILEFNNRLIPGNPELLLKQPETNGWVAKINPALPYDRKGLLMAEQYRTINKNKHAKG